MPNILIALPCFNEEDRIVETVVQIKTLINDYSSNAQFDLIVFDDASTDKSVQVILEKGIKVHVKRNNQGLGKNFQTILDHAINGNYDYLVTCDADGQFPIEELQKIIEITIEAQPEFVTASRFKNQVWSRDVPSARRQGNKLVRQIVKFITGRHISDVTCGLRSYSREVFLKFQLSENFSYTIETITQILLHGFRVTEVPIRVIYFEDRKSTISGSLFRYGLKTLAIAIRLASGKALTRFSRFIASLFPLGIIMIVLFLVNSSNTGKFTGNLYLAFSGAGIILISLLALVIFLITSKLDRVSNMLQTLNHSVKAIDDRCVDCRETL